MKLLFIIRQVKRGLRYQSLASSALKQQGQDDPAMIHAVC
jgi:hypothetical protein